MSIRTNLYIFFVSSYVLFHAECAEQPVQAIYVSNMSDDNVYRVDPTTGGSLQINQSPIEGGMAGIVGLKLLNNNLAYTAGFFDSNVYSIDLTTGSTARVTNSPVGPLGGLAAIALLDDTTAYMTNTNDNTLYAVDLKQGTHKIVNNSPIVVPSSELLGVALKNNVAYVIDFFSPNIYSVDIINGNVNIFTTQSPVSGLIGISILNNTAYVVSDLNSVYAVDLSTGDFRLIIDLPGAILFSDIAVANETLAYVTGALSNQVYAINLLDGTYSIVTPTPVPGNNAQPFGFGLFGIGLAFVPEPPIPPPIPKIITTQGLFGSILHFAKYLNANAPLSTLNLFSDLSGSSLKQALEKAIPTRLAFATFASQNGYLASEQVVIDHLYKKRFAQTRNGGNELAQAQNFALNDLMADALALEGGNAKQCVQTPNNTNCPKKGYFTGWLAPFGEYAREKSQSQTPAFTLGVGGVVVGADYDCADENTVGLALSYAYTHVHEKQGMGLANVNQGFLGVYTALHAANWYFDFGAWGGYYHTHNERKIFFPGFDNTAKSKTHGWQVAPHFEVGYDGYFPTVCSIQWFGIEPFLLADWVGNWEHGFQEHGAEGLNMSQKGKFCSLFRGETGLRFHEIVRCDWGQLVFQEKGSYAYQKMFHTGNVQATLIGSPSSFTVTTLTSPLNLGVVEFSMLFKPCKKSLPYVDFRYQGEFGSKYQSHQGIVEIGKNF